MSLICGGSAATTCRNLVDSVVMFPKVNCDSMHANQPRGLSFENCGGLTDTALHIVVVFSLLLPPVVAVLLIIPVVSSPLIRIVLLIELGELCVEVEPNPAICCAMKLSTVCC